MIFDKTAHCERRTGQARDVGVLRSGGRRIS